DIEAWFPAQGRYREITSCSNTTDYQSRRLNIRFRRGGQLEFVHTLNGTRATARALLAVMENFQDDGGTGAVPDVLLAYAAPAALGGAGSCPAGAWPRCRAALPLDQVDQRPAETPQDLLPLAVVIGVAERSPGAPGGPVVASAPGSQRCAPVPPGALQP